MLHSVKMSGHEAKEAAMKKKAKDDREAASEALESGRKEEERS